MPQYYVSGNHEAIIDPAVWEEAQRETACRKHPSVRSDHPFSAKIRCGGCGGWFGRKPGTSHPSTPATFGGATDPKDRQTRRRQAYQVLDYLQTQQPLNYTPQAWNTLVTEVTVSVEGVIKVRFRDEP